ncbi:MAG: shikimate dehydrogenase [Clostridia bacterium]|nr:shikimate dehydrogenase [Clostridia bacterium]
MVKLAVIGKDVSQSVSPQIHKFIGEKLGLDLSYEKISIPQEEFETRVEEMLSTYDGFNVTIPYKLSVIPHLNKIEGDALSFGAVNTVVTKTRTGYNTDGLGFSQLLASENIDVNGKEVLLLGAGGAGRSVAKKLLDGGAKLELYDLNAANAKKVAEEFKGITDLDEVTPKKRALIVNATGVGMHNTVGKSPVGEDIIKLTDAAVDLIYFPVKSQFLKIAEGFGKKAVNGSAMLFYQAYYAFCYYFDMKPDAALAKKLFGEFNNLNG